MIFSLLLVVAVMLSEQFRRTVLSSANLFLAAFACGIALAVRPVAIFAALSRSGRQGRERVVAAWFGPRGFASKASALLVLQSGVADGPGLFHLVAAVVVSSIVIHSTLDVPVARWAADGSGEPDREPAPTPVPSGGTGSGVDPR